MLGPKSKFSFGCQVSGGKFAKKKKIIIEYKNTENTKSQRPN